MRLLIQRVNSAKVTLNSPERPVAGAIGVGLLVLVGIAKEDTREDADFLLRKLLALRIFPDDSGKMNRNIAEIGGSLLIVSQFTLFGDCRRGNRPSFDRAAPPEDAMVLYNYFVDSLRSGSVPVATGVFQASMEVHLVNDGPVTIVMESEDRRPSPSLKGDR